MSVAQYGTAGSHRRSGSPSGRAPRSGLAATSPLPSGAGKYSVAAAARVGNLQGLCARSRRPPLLGASDAADYPLSSRFSSFRKRQLVPSARIFGGEDLIMPASFNRSA